MQDDLVSVCLIEKDWENEVQIVWAFPDLDRLQRALTLSRINKFFAHDREENTNSFLVGRCGRMFQYLRWSDQSINRDVVNFGVCVFSNDFNPQFYHNYVNLLCDIYAASKRPVPLLQTYLDLTVNGSCEGLSRADFDGRRALVQPLEESTITVVDIIEELGADWILLWSALMFKKKICVVHENPSVLMEIVPSLIQLVWHRRSELVKMIHPIVGQGKIEALHLSKSIYFIAGYTEKTLAKQNYDVILDMNSRSIELAKHCSNDFNLCKFQKEIAQNVLTSITESRPQVQGFIKLINGQNQNLLQKIDSLKEDGVLTRESLEERGFAEKTLKFLLLTSQAEGMLTNV